MAFENFNIIRVSLPKEGHDRPNLVTDTIALLKQSAPIGVMGNYGGVYELSDAREGYTPLHGANPTKGLEGKDETCAASLFTTYAPINTPPDILDKFVADLVELHPWEHPVVEIWTGRIWVKP